MLISSVVILSAAMWNVQRELARDFRYESNNKGSLGPRFNPGTGARLYKLEYINRVPFCCGKAHVDIVNVAGALFLAGVATYTLAIIIKVEASVGPDWFLRFVPMGIMLFASAFTGSVVARLGTALS